MASKWNRNERPPRAVMLSVAIHAIGTALGFIYFAAVGRSPQSVSGWLIWLFVICILFFYYRAVYVGYNWARWLSTIFVVLGVALLPYTLPTVHAESEKVVRLIQLTFHATAAILLFLPSSGWWFRSNYSVKRTLTS